jgi:dynein heavy chain
MGLNNFKEVGDAAFVYHMAGSYCLSYFPFRYRPLLNEIETEVRSDYQYSLRQAILPYTVPGLEERQRLKIEIYSADYPAIFIRAPVPWHCTVMASNQMLDHKLFIVNPILLRLRDLWEFQ